MKKIWQRRTKRAAAAMPLALALALSAGQSFAQEKKVVPFLTAESTPESVAEINALIATFEAENPDIKVELQLMASDGRMSRIINAVSVGDELGIFEIDRRLVPDFTSAGYLLPLDSIVEDVGVEKFAAGSLLYWPWDGHLYHFTSDVSVGTLYWRKDLYEQAGLAEPDSYERLIEAAEKLHGQNGVSGGAFETSNGGTANRFTTFLWQNCGDFYTKAGEVAFDRPGSKQAVEDYAALNKFAPAGNHSWGAREPVSAYVSGRVATAFFPGRLGYEVATNAPDIAKVTGNREARFARGAKGPRVTYGPITSYAIGSTVKHPEEAKKFLQHLFTGERLLAYAMAAPGHIVPVIKDVQAQLLEQDDPYIKEYREWVELILEMVPYTNSEAQNMGSITDQCVFEKSLVPMPWASRVFGQESVVARLFQRVSLQGASVDEAYQEAVDSFRTHMEAWKQENTWTPAPDAAPAAGATSAPVAPAQ
jgi:multiple sugar transport system substrate-binding protein